MKAHMLWLSGIIGSIRGKSDVKMHQEITFKNIYVQIFWFCMISFLPNLTLLMIPTTCRLLCPINSFIK